MLAMMLDQPERFRMVDVPVPVPNGNQALVRVTAAGICASDLGTIHGHSPIAAYPLIPGHECAGEVVSAPSNSSFRTGDLVTIFPSVGCGTCKACRENRTNQCPTFKVLGIGLPGGCFAEYVAANVDQLIRLPESVYRRFGALVEPLSVGTHINRRGATGPGDVVLVIGAGAIGLCSALVARAKGAGKVVLVDRFESRRQVLARLGFTDFTTASGGELTKWLADNFGPFDIVLDNVCSESTFQVGTSALRPGGRYVLVALPHGDRHVPVPYSPIYRKELSLVASRNYMRVDFVDAVAMLESGAVNLDGMVTATFPLAQLPQALAELEGHPERHIKVLVTP